MPDLPQQITVDDVTLTLAVERKRVKNVNARLRGSTLYISAPPSMSSERMETIVADLARKLLRREQARRANNEEEALALASKVAGRFPQPPQIERSLFVTNQRTRWGSYSQKTNTVRLNAALRKMPRWVLEAVVAHELAHAIHPDHSPAFWELLHSVCPETGRAMAFLEGVGWLATQWENMSWAELAQLTGAEGPRVDT
ncbi:M48 family metallopeptidase [Rubrobacter aplysinae]|uniref:M48 family metallopeptidase n=1 Tax=Rubrobacter aplysinae TaxID=909625 RepID=UPI00064BCBED|nr:M48 family metallopeptidase [Rubrobacter aplysinae]